MSDRIAVMNARPHRAIRRSADALCAARDAVRDALRRRLLGTARDRRGSARRRWSARRNARRVVCARTGDWPSARAAIVATRPEHVALRGRAATATASTRSTAASGRSPFRARAQRVAVDVGERAISSSRSAARRRCPMPATAGRGIAWPVGAELRLSRAGSRAMTRDASRRRSRTLRAALRWLALAGAASCSSCSMSRRSPISFRRACSDNGGFSLAAYERMLGDAYGLRWSGIRCGSA